MSKDIDDQVNEARKNYEAFSGKKNTTENFMGMDIEKMIVDAILSKPQNVQIAKVVVEKCRFYSNVVVLLLASNQYKEWIDTLPLGDTKATVSDDLNKLPGLLNQVAAYVGSKISG